MSHPNVFQVGDEIYDSGALTLESYIFNLGNVGGGRTQIGLGNPPTSAAGTMGNLVDVRLDYFLLDPQTTNDLVFSFHPDEEARILDFLRTNNYFLRIENYNDHFIFLEVPFTEINTTTFSGATLFNIVLSNEQRTKTREILPAGNTSIRLRILPAGSDHITIYQALHIDILEGQRIRTRLDFLDGKTKNVLYPVKNYQGRIRVVSNQVEDAEGVAELFEAQAFWFYPSRYISDNSNIKNHPLMNRTKRFELQVMGEINYSYRGENREGGAWELQLAFNTNREETI